MESTAVPKYQAIYAVLRQQILDGEIPAGSRLESQQELANRFGVTLMTLRQALSSLETDGLVWAARGKGTFVAERPIDVGIGNLSSFSAAMSSAGVALKTKVLGIEQVKHAGAARALDSDGSLWCLTRQRLVKKSPLGLQRSYLAVDVGLAELGSGSLYSRIEAATGWVVSEATESIDAVAVDAETAAVLQVDAGSPALLSIRTSINQFGQPFLYDEALLVGGRCTITANRTSDRLSLQYKAP